MNAIVAAILFATFLGGGLYAEVNGLKPDILYWGALGALLLTIGEMAYGHVRQRKNS